MAEIKKRSHYRPAGFPGFVDDEGFHTIYLVTAQNYDAVKVGVAKDARQRFTSIQCANFIKLDLHRFWWIAGRPLSHRVERSFKDEFASQNIRGEWHSMKIDEAVNFVEKKITELCPWSATDGEMVEFYNRKMEYLTKRAFE